MRFNQNLSLASQCSFKVLVEYFNNSLNSHVGHGRLVVVTEHAARRQFFCESFNNFEYLLRIIMIVLRSPILLFAANTTICPKSGDSKITPSSAKQRHVASPSRCNF